VFIFGVYSFDGKEKLGDSFGLPSPGMDFDRLVQLPDSRMDAQSALS